MKSKSPHKIGPTIVGGTTVSYTKSYHILILASKLPLPVILIESVSVSNGGTAARRELLSEGINAVHSVHSVCDQKVLAVAARSSRRLL